MLSRIAMIATLFLSTLCVWTSSAAAPVLLQHAVTARAVIVRFNKQEHLTLVDVRAPQHFERLHIPGSLNIPAFALKTKTFLKSTPIVLIDAGYHPAKLNTMCERLRQAGFEADFLFGGLNAWRMQDGPFTGDPFAIENVNRISQQAFFQEHHAPYWLVIEGLSTGTPETHTLIPHAIPLSVSDPAQFLSDLRTAVANHERRPWQAIVISDERGEGYARLIPALSDASLPPVFFLEGGRQGYRQFTAMHTTLRQRLHTTPTEGSACTK